MRLPLYRAKSIDTGEWGIGYITKQYGSWFLVEESNSETNPLNSYPVDPETICQCTGFSYTKLGKDEDGMDFGYWITQKNYKLEVVGNAFDSTS